MTYSPLTVPEFGWTSTKPECSAPYIVPALQQQLNGMPRNARLLDIGCGNGYNAGRFLEWGFDVVGIDISSEGVRIAQEEYPQARFVRMDICEDLLDRLGVEPFDVVSSTEVVEHLYDPHQWARCCYNALKPGGTLLATTPYHGYLKNLVISIVNGWDVHFEALRNGGHIKFFSKRTLTSLLTGVGFKNIRYFGLGRAPYLWKSMLVKAIKQP